MGCGYHASFLTSDVFLPIKHSHSLLSFFRVQNMASSSSSFLFRPYHPSSSLLSNENHLTFTNYVSLPHYKYLNPQLKTSFKVRALKEKIEEETNTTSSTSPDDITEKFGLEAGLWKIFSTKDEGKEREGQKSKGNQAKELLAKYGGAYLVTSITLSLISFSLCYVLISSGVDVQALLQKVGISPSETGEKVGTFALAYAAHKAASPIRFPPTVALTPIVAGWIGKNNKKE